MKKFSLRILISILLKGLLLIYSCTPHIPRITNRAFYYWKSVYTLTGFEKNYLSRLRVNTLYIKMFDVTWNDETKSAIPAAQIQFKDTSYKLFSNNTSYFYN